MIIEERGKTKEGFEYIIGIHSKLGHRLGYVGVYEDSPLYQEDYTHDEPDIEESIDSIDSLDYNVHVHGGLTYSGSLYQNVIGASNPYYFGFDCAHLDDGKITPTEMKAIVELHCKNLSDSKQQKLLNDYTQIYTMLPDFTNAYAKDKSFVKNECEHLSSQLKSLEADYRSK